MNREEKFLNALKDVFVGTPVEGESGFINLMRIKARYFEQGVFPHLMKDINEAVEPLLLTIIALVNWRGRKLPNRRIEVYGYAAETLIETWPSVQRGITFDPEEVLALLEPAAYRIFADRSSDEIPEGELLPLLVQAMVEVKPGIAEPEARRYIAGLLPKLSEHSGLFLERGFDIERGERLFGFLHLTFAEYLAARHLARRWEFIKDDGERRDFLARYAHVPRWREPVLLMAQHLGLDGHRVRATQVLADILQMPAPYEDHLHGNLLLAGQCLGEDLRVEPQASDWVFDRLIECMLETPLQGLWNAAAYLWSKMALAAHGGALTDRLLSALEDEREQVRLRAAFALGEIKSERAIEALIELLNSEDAEVRADAAWALGEIESERAVDALIARLEDESEDVRANAARALGEIKSERAVEALIGLLNSEDQELCRDAVIALGKTNSDWAMDTLMALLDSEWMFGAAAVALSKMESERAVDALIARLEDESEDVRRSAIIVLREIKSERAVEALVARLGCPDPWL